MKDDVIHGFYKILDSVKPIKIESKEDSIFSLKYDLSTEEIVYILIKTSEECNFYIDSDFIDSLEDSSFHNIEKMIVHQINKVGSI